MNLTWYGHASFGITAQNGLHIVTDPYDPATSGYKPFSDPADIVLMSSDNDSFHCNAHLVPQKDGGEVINALKVAQTGGVYESHGVTVRAIQAMEHLEHDQHDPDQNGMYRFEIDGIRIGHMGDVGNPFTDEQINFFKDLDIFLALAGGFPTIDLGELKTIIDATRPKWVVPMHFRTLRYKARNSFWISTFLDYFDETDVDIASDSSLEITKEDLPAETRVLVLDYA